MPTKWTIYLTGWHNVVQSVISKHPCPLTLMWPWHWQDCTDFSLLKMDLASYCHITLSTSHLKGLLTFDLGDETLILERLYELVLSLYYQCQAFENGHSHSLFWRSTYYVATYNMVLKIIIDLWPWCCDYDLANFTLVNSQLVLKPALL